MIITCRRIKRTGKPPGSEEASVCSREAIAEGVRLRRPRRGRRPPDRFRGFSRTRRIVSYHNFRKTPDDLRDLRAGCHWASIPTSSGSPRWRTRRTTTMRMLEMMQEARSRHRRHVHGRHPRRAVPDSRRQGSERPFTCATFHLSTPVAPGQTSSFHADDRATSTNYLSGSARTPRSTASSPTPVGAQPRARTFTTLTFQALGIDAQFTFPSRVPGRCCSAVHRRCARLGWRRLSVTIPHKEQIAASTSRRSDPAVKSIAAVNTAIFDGHEIVGYNTDYNAAMDCLEMALGEIGVDPSPLKGKRVLVLGPAASRGRSFLVYRKRGATITIASADAGGEAGATGQCVRSEGDRLRMRAIAAPTKLSSTVRRSACTRTSTNRRSRRPSSTGDAGVRHGYNPESTLLIKDARSRDGRRSPALRCSCGKRSGSSSCLRDRKPTELMREVLKRAIGPVKYFPPPERQEEDEGIDLQTDDSSDE